ncbi:MAG: dTDP-4-dehydrorhamnose 3,5-epimerase family protein [Carboxylicivirga sp.]|jgi:dTDP-4-dehydrorhamnose 3,5-epimerase/CDP-3, 6-dideoxy-D-glycero-D-glycero-4-hexulose-5-epimerase|nr:dTDP-4-dehydrorhamnose 3,5-epimerase family protein [Carboxylicivirga sp.]
MKVEETFISGLKVIELNEFKDDRGSFVKVFNKDFFAENDLVTDFSESYFSISAKNVIRGMHFQVPPSDHVKIVYVNAGSILDVVLDIRKSSSTYGKFFTLEMDALDRKLLYIPKGCAHGFKSCENNSMVTYLQNTVYDPVSDRGINFNSFGMNWGVNVPIISERDNQFVDFDHYKSPF